MKKNINAEKIIIGIGLFCLLGTLVMPFAGETVSVKIMGTIFYCIISVACLGFTYYSYKYFKSEQFYNTKSKIEKYIQECNELNEHIEELKKSYIDFNKNNYGSVQFYDNSHYNYKRNELKSFTNSQYVLNCSSTICNGAKNQPFKYLCKYFNIEITEDTLIKFEKVFNDFSSAEQGKILLRNQKNKILKSVENEIPYLIRLINRDKLSEKLGFKPIIFNQLYFPKYSFVYISNGGNSSMRCDIVLDLNNLEQFINYLSSQIKWKNSVKGQRALMTTALRTKIKERDHYTCQQCNLSTNDEPNLLLEIDHIKPISKGGMTTEKNLQTLCWKCNRSKGNKII